MNETKCNWWRSEILLTLQLGSNIKDEDGLSEWDWLCPASVGSQILVAVTAIQAAVLFGLCLSSATLGC